MLYRVTHPLSRRDRVYPIGALVTLDWVNPEGIQKLVQVGAVSPVHPPPIAALKDWTTRAGRLAKRDIIDLDQLVTADPEGLASQLGISVATVRRWQSEAAGLLSPPPEDKC